MRKKHWLYPMIAVNLLFLSAACGVKRPPRPAYSIPLPFTEEGATPSPYPSPANNSGSGSGL